MTPNDRRRVVDILAAFADSVGRLPALDDFFLARLERALDRVLEERVKTIL